MWTGYLINSQCRDVLCFFFLFMQNFACVISFSDGVVLALYIYRVSLNEL